MENQVDHSGILDEYYRGGLIVSPPPQELRDACNKYAQFYLDYQNLAKCAETSDAKFKAEANQQLIGSFPELLRAQQTYTLLLCQFFAEAKVVNTLKTLGFDFKPHTGEPFQTFDDFLKGTRPKDSDSRGT